MLSAGQYRELVRSTYQGSFADHAKRLGQLFDPLVEWVAAPGFPYGGTYHGPTAIEEHVFAPIARDWTGYYAVVTEVHDAGDSVVALGTYYGTYRKTNRSMHAAFAHVWTMRAKRIVRLQLIVDSAKVREAM